MTKPRGFIRRRKIGSGVRYYAAITVNGREEALGGFSSRERAIQALRTAESEISLGKFGQPEPEPVLTFGQFFERYMAAKSKSLKASTLADYEITFRLHILPHFADKPIDSITRLDVQSWIDSLNLSPATVAKTYRYFRAAMHVAEDWELIERQPCKKIILPRAEHQEVDFLRPPEIAVVLEHIREPERTCVAVLAYSGIRTGEARALQWKHIDFENHVITVEKSWNLHNGIDDPKSASSRRAVPMLPHLESILRDFYQRQGSPSPDAFLFLAGEKPLEIRRRFETALKRAGLRHVTVHSLRHGFASLLLANGASIKAVQRALGHGSAVLTLSTYSHLLNDDFGSAALAVNAAIAGTDGNVISLENRREVIGVERIHRAGDGAHRAGTRAH